MEIRASMANYLDMLRRERCLSKNTLRVYKSELSQLVAWLWDKHMVSYVAHLEVLLPKDISLFWTGCEPPLTPAGQRLRRSITSGWLQFMYRRGIMKSEKLWHLDAVRRNQGARTTAEINITPKSDMTAREKCLWALLSAGLRIAEIAAVTPADFTVNYQRLIVKGKGGKQRIAVFDDKESEALCHYIALRRTDLFVFSSDSSISSLRNEIKALSIEGAAPHDYRRAFASDCYKNQIDAKVIQSALGHSSASTTGIYISKSAKQESLMRDYKKAHPRA